MTEPIIQQKTCRLCKISKPFSDYYRKPSYKDGLTSFCKPCIAKKTKSYHAKMKARTDLPELLEKHCPKCKQVLPIHFFCKATKEKSGYKSWCKPCDHSKGRTEHQIQQTRERLLNPPKPIPEEVKKTRQKLYKYKLSLVDYERLCESQKGKCAICKKTPKRKLVIDHCHTTGKVRGLLCMYCNIALGFLGDNIAGVEKAVKYLQTNEKVQA